MGKEIWFYDYSIEYINIIYAEHSINKKFLRITSSLNHKEERNSPLKVKDAYTRFQLSFQGKVKKRKTVIHQYMMTQVQK